MTPQTSSGAPLRACRTRASARWRGSSIKRASSRRLVADRSGLRYGRRRGGRAGGVGARGLPLLDQLRGMRDAAELVVVDQRGDGGVVDADGAGGVAPR